MIEPGLLTPDGVAVPAPSADIGDLRDADGGLARRVALGTVIQQAGQAAGLVTGLVLATALARNLTLAQFGVYGFITSLATYAFFALGSAETAAVRVISQATDQVGRDRAYTTAVVVYTGMGLVSGVLVALGGQLLLAAFDMSPSLRHEARIGIVAVGAATAVGFPLRLHQDLLRASQRFALAGIAESLGWCALGATVLILLFAVQAPIWALAAAGGAIPAFLGLSALVIGRLARLPYRLAPGLVTGADLRGFVGISGYMFFIAATDIPITSLDRAILGAFRSASAVGLYEGAFRLNNLVRAFTGSLSLTVLPVSSRLAAAGDLARERELLMRGTRYMLAAVVPPTVALMVLADEVLAVWLGPKYSTAGTAAAIFLVWWLLAPNISIANSLMVVESRFRWLAVYSWTVAAVNLAASLALTPLIGVEGVAAGTTIGYMSMFPFFMRYVFERHHLPLHEFARTIWLPAYATGAVLALVLFGVRNAIALNTAGEVLGVAVGGVLIAWAAFYLTFLSSEERALFKGLLGRRAGRPAT
jgi:O-antigen/teichoic acid export membrane protein